MYTKGRTNNSERTLGNGTKLRVRLPFSETTRCRSPGPNARAPSGFAGGAVHAFPRQWGSLQVGIAVFEFTVPFAEGRSS